MRNVSAKEEQEKDWKGERDGEKQLQESGNPRHASSNKTTLMCKKVAEETNLPEAVTLE